ncbi:MAG: ComF family protein [Solirubrobacterales bacterium]
MVCARALGAQRPLPLSAPGVDAGWAAAPYDGTARRLIAALKFGRRLTLACVAADAIAAVAPRGTLAGHALVPVPPDPWRARLRGFDPATLIAGNLARRLGLPLSHCLSRRHSPRQVGRARAERIGSPPAIRTRGEVPSSCVLVDDVTTTGATLAACAGSLRAAGAEEILALAFARA